MDAASSIGRGRGLLLNRSGNKGGEVNFGSFLIGTLEDYSSSNRAVSNI